MPVSYDMPRASSMWNVSDVSLYQKLPYYLAALNAKYFPTWNTWNKLFGKTQWEPNMGTTMRGVRPEPTPVGRQVFYPNPITSAPKKDVAEVREMTAEGIVYRHLFESPYFHFLPSFQDFRRDQVSFAMKDLAQQIMVANDMFIRSYIFQRAPRIFISGASSEYQEAPIVTNTATDDTNGKTTNYLLSAINQVGSQKGNLSLKACFKALCIIREDEQAPAWEGMSNTPKDNEVIKGRYVMVGSNEAFAAFTFDDHMLQYKKLDLDIINDEFSGLLFGALAYKTERFPLRIAADGTLPVPQIWVNGTAAGASSSTPFNYGETVPNPDYVNAPFEVAWIMGAEPYRTIAVGAPPKEFASGRMSENKFNSLFWNGEVRLTDNLIINYGSNTYDTNKYGEFLQLISSVVLGALPVNRRFAFPIIYRRVRPTTN